MFKVKPTVTSELLSLWPNGINCLRFLFCLRLYLQKYKMYKVIRKPWQIFTLNDLKLRSQQFMKKKLGESMGSDIWLYQWTQNGNHSHVWTTVHEDFFRKSVFSTKTKYIYIFHVIKKVKEKNLFRLVSSSKLNYIKYTRKKIFLRIGCFEKKMCGIRVQN